MVSETIFKFLLIGLHKFWLVFYLNAGKWEGQLLAALVVNMGDSDILIEISEFKIFGPFLFSVLLYVIKSSFVIKIFLLHDNSFQLL